MLRTLNDTEGLPLKKSTIWGRSCDPNDQVESDILLPELQSGDWLILENFGGYRFTTSSFFNGFTPHPAFNFVERKIWYVQYPSSLYLTVVGDIKRSHDVMSSITRGFNSSISNKVDSIFMNHVAKNFSKHLISRDDFKAHKLPNIDIDYEVEEEVE